MPHDHGSGHASELASPLRNRYFYGKLLDEYHLDLEQRYFNDKRWLLNRLTHGAGVLCGLGVARTKDRRRIVVGPGVALDGLGREIVVPKASPAVDPRQPTDECGAPEGDALEGAGIVTLCLAYHECETEAQPSYACDCDDDDGCEHGAVRERYRVLVIRGLPEPPPVLDDKTCSGIFGPRAMRSTASPGRVPGRRVETADSIRTTAAFDRLARDLPRHAKSSRRELICRAIDVACAPDETCIPIAVVELEADGTIGTVDPCAFRPVVYSNEVLFEMILCLADRLDECCDERPPTTTRRIERISGDGQSALAGTAVAQPLVARVFEGNAPLPNVAVTFAVTAGGGHFAGNATSITATTDQNGDARAAGWVLGTNAGNNLATASIAQGNPASVPFAAIATARPQEQPPRILRAWPRNGEVITVSGASAPDALRARRWGASPYIELTFDRDMDPADLANVLPWLRLGLVSREGQAGQLRRLPLKYAGRSNAPELPGTGVTERFALDPAPPPAELQTRAFITLVRAANGTIQAAGGGALLLDAEFSGGLIGGATPSFDELWTALGGGTMPSGARLLPLHQALTAGGSFAQLPGAGSGNGTPGGDYHAGFRADKLG